ncbi:MAG: tRNA uridine-5-carboxymethylaminomethyl(34) synthesis GTPase MnmE [Bacteroidales bacterium]
MTEREQTICAPATSSGGAVSMIRVSGTDSLEIFEKIFSPYDKRHSISELSGYNVVHGEISDGHVIIDDVLVTVFRSPRSYTGENAVEISCHGSSYIITRILELLIANGARAAVPGEFTRRAFLNGKMDLSQAEAVADLVASGSEASHRIAINQIRGGFSAEIGKLRSVLIHFASLIELELDFGEEDVEFADRDELLKAVGKTKHEAERLASSFRLGNAIRNGIPVAIVGKPNSGKSTLLNALLNEEKAIVSDIPGTTRDAIEDTINIEGIIYRVTDTAGLRDTEDTIENLGIRKTHEKIMQASVVMMIDEATSGADEINERVRFIRKLIEERNCRLFIIVNKIDLVGEHVPEDLRKSIDLDGEESLLFISAIKSTGLEILRKKLGDVAEAGRLADENVIITNIRHFEALRNVSESLERVITGFSEKIPDDIIAIDIRQAIHYLGEITGQITTDEILGNIFRNFCIGK